MEPLHLHGPRLLRGATIGFDVVQSTIVAVRRADILSGGEGREALLRSGEAFGEHLHEPWRIDTQQHIRVGRQA
jgi:hypothetical protein